MLALGGRAGTEVQGKANQLDRQAKQGCIPLEGGHLMAGSQIFRLKNSILSEWSKFRTEVGNDAI